MISSPLVYVMLSIRIIVNVVANKLKRTLGRTIGPFQSAFIKDKSISDNYIMVQEVPLSFKEKKKTKLMGPKIDMVKRMTEWNGISLPRYYR